MRESSYNYTVLYICFEIKSNQDELRLRIYEDEQRQLSTIFEYDKDLAMNFDHFLDNPGLHLIAHLTFGYLDFSSVERCRRVSKKWKEFLENETDYRSQAFEEIRRRLIVKRDTEFPYSEELQIRYAAWVEVTHHYEEDVDFATRQEFLYFMKRFYAKERNACDTPLDFAGEFGYLEIVKYCMENGFNFKRFKHKNAMLYAAEYGQIEVLKYLFENVNKNGVDINEPDTHGNTIFHISARFGHLDVMNFTLDFGVQRGLDIHECNDAGYPAFFIASPVCYEALMERGYDLISTDIWGRTLLVKAVTNRNRELVEQLLTKTGKEVIINRGYDRKPMHFACWYSCDSMLKLLLKHSINDIDFLVEDRKGWTPIDYAADNPETLKILMKLYTDGYFSKFEFNQTSENNYNLTPKQIAISNEKSLRLLLESHDNGLVHLDLDFHDKDGRNLLFTSARCFKSFRFCLHYLHLNGLLDNQLKQLDNDGNTLVHQLALFKRTEPLQFLSRFYQEHSYVIDWNSKNRSGKTPFQLVCSVHKTFIKNGSTERETGTFIGCGKIIEVFLELSKRTFIDLNILDEAGLSPFFITVMTESNQGWRKIDTFSMTKAFLAYSIEFGINLNRLALEQGMTALHWLSANGKEQGVRIMLEYSDNSCLDLNPLDYSKGRTPLHLACKAGHSGVVKAFLDFGKKRKICLNPRDVKGMTPLHIACKKNQKNIVKLFRSFENENKGEILRSVLDAKGLTAFDYAVKK